MDNGIAATCIRPSTAAFPACPLRTCLLSARSGGDQLYGRVPHGYVRLVSLEGMSHFHSVGEVGVVNTARDRLFADR